MEEFSLKRWPWLTRRDADLLEQYYAVDPTGAKEYERHLLNERDADWRFHGRQVRVTSKGIVSLKPGEEWRYVPFYDERLAAQLEALERYKVRRTGNAAALARWDAKHDWPRLENKSWYYDDADMLWYYSSKRWWRVSGTCCPDFDSDFPEWGCGCGGWRFLLEEGEPHQERSTSDANWVAA